MWGYKIFECVNGEPRFIMRSWRGTRQVPLDVWLKAENKWKHEGGGPYYTTGFHVLPTRNALTFIARFFRKIENKVVVQVEYEDVFSKPTKSVSVLANRMRVSNHAWRERKPLTEFKDA